MIIIIKINVVFKYICIIGYLEIHCREAIFMTSNMYGKICIKDSNIFYIYCYRIVILVCHFTFLRSDNPCISPSLFLSLSFSLSRFSKRNIFLYSLLFSHILYIHAYTRSTEPYDHPVNSISRFHYLVRMRWFQ